MDFETLILTIASKLDDIPGSKKSIIQADIANLSNEIEDHLFKLKVSENNYKRLKFIALKEQNIAITEAIGLLFLSYVTYHLRPKLTYQAIWSIITEDVMRYERTTTFFKDNYLNNDHANYFLVKCIGDACKRFDLRNAYEHQDGEHYIRNTILLQMGLLNKFRNLNVWLSGYLNQNTIRVLLNKEDEYYSNSFSQGWRVLRRYRDNIINNSVATSLLKQNVWFKELDIDNALIAARKKLGTQFLVEEEIENIFFLSQIFYENNLLKFVINAEDLYALNLSGNDYSVYVNNEYYARVLRNEDKVLELDKEITIIEPKNDHVFLELRNEDGDVVFSDEIIFFDVNNQVLIFDDKGTIYKDFLKKLSPNREYNILFDSELDCSAPKKNQVDYFQGFVTLATHVTKTNNCTLSYDGEELFSLNFTKTIEKPIWMDNLVIYAADSRLYIEESTKFNLKIFYRDDDSDIANDLPRNMPLDLPAEAKIIRWTYGGSYVDESDINDFIADITLSPELICERKHSLMIRYEGQTYHRVVQSVIYDQTNKYHLMQRLKDGNINIIERSLVLNHDELIQSRLHLALFNYDKSKDPRIIKDKMKYYGKVELNKKFQLKSFPKFGETVIASEHLFNDPGIILFKSVQQGIVKKYDAQTKTVYLNTVPSYINDCEFIVIDQEYNIRSLTTDIIDISNNMIKLDQDYLSIAIVYEDNYIGSFVQYDKINFRALPKDSEVLKVFYLSYIPLLLMDKPILFEWMQDDNIFTFFEAFMSDTYETPSQQTIHFNFSEINAAIDHILFDMLCSESEARHILQEIILKGWAEKAIQLPILLVDLLSIANEKKYISYFQSYLTTIEAPLDRDVHFIDIIVNGLLSHHDLNQLDKHNLKIAMHYKNRMYYLNEALNKLQEG